MALETNIVYVNQFTDDATADYGTGDFTVSGATHETGYKEGGGYSFDGVNDELVCNAADVKQTGSCSYAVWFKSSDTSNTYRSLFGDKPFNGGGVSFSMQVTTRDWWLEVYSDSTRIIAKFDESEMTGYNDGNWHLIVCTVSAVATSWDLKVYLDGSELTNFSELDFNKNDNTIEWSTSGGLVLANAHINSNYMEVDIDELYIWDTVLTSSEVTELWNSGDGAFWNGTSFGVLATTDVTKGSVSLSGKTLDNKVVTSIVNGSVELSGKTISTSVISNVSKGDVVLSGKVIYAHVVNQIATVSKGVLSLSDKEVENNIIVDVTKGEISLSGKTINVNIVTDIVKGFMSLSGKTVETNTDLGGLFKFKGEVGGSGFVPNDIVLARLSDYNEFGILETLYELYGLVVEVPKKSYYTIALVGTSRDFDVFRKYKSKIQLVRVGSLSDHRRQDYISVSTDDWNSNIHSPHMTFYDGVSSIADIDSSDKAIARIGNLYGIENSRFRGWIKDSNDYDEVGYYIDYSVDSSDDYTDYTWESSSDGYLYTATGIEILSGDLVDKFLYIAYASDYLGNDFSIDTGNTMIGFTFKDSSGETITSSDIVVWYNFLSLMQEQEGKGIGIVYDRDYIIFLHLGFKNGTNFSFVWNYGTGEWLSDKRGIYIGGHAFIGDEDSYIKFNPDNSSLTIKSDTIDLISDDILLRTSYSSSQRASVIVSSINGGTVIIDAKNIEINGSCNFTNNYDPSEKTRTFRQASTVTPTGMTEGDMWIQTDNGDKPYTYDGSDWIQSYTNINGGSISTGTIDGQFLHITGDTQFDSDVDIRGNLTSAYASGYEVEIYKDATTAKGVLKFNNTAYSDALISFDNTGQLTIDTPSINIEAGVGGTATLYAGGSNAALMTGGGSSNESRVVAFNNSYGTKGIWFKNGSSDMRWDNTDGLTIESRQMMTKEGVHNFVDSDSNTHSDSGTYIKILVNGTEKRLKVYDN